MKKTYRVEKAANGASSIVVCSDGRRKRLRAGQRVLRRLFSGEGLNDMQRLKVQLACGLGYCKASVPDQLLLNEAFRKLVGCSRRALTW